jgi:hypothetical protein
MVRDSTNPGKEEAEVLTVVGHLASTEVEKAFEMATEEMGIQG